MGKSRMKTKGIKSICAVLFSLSLIFSVLFPTIVHADNSQIIPNDETGIPDKDLYQIILWQLHKEDGEKITKDEAAKIYYIDVFTVPEPGVNAVNTLKGIENLPNLNTLGIGDNQLTSLQGIEKLTNLQTLRIGKGQLKNINEIVNLPKLTELRIKGNPLEDWTTVSNLTNLETLCISDCGLTDSNLENIAGRLTKLKELSVSGNRLKSLSGIENLTQLQTLDASGNKLTSLNEIQNLTRLEYLDVQKNKLTNLPNLKKLENLSLEYTWFFNNKISEKAFKKNMPAHVSMWWINNQVLFQNLPKKLKVNNFKKIKSTTSKITGMTEKKAKVVLSTSKGKKIKTVKADKKGVFSFNKLNLKGYKGKKLKITSYLLYDDQVNGERHYTAVKTVKFTV